MTEHEIRAHETIEDKIARFDSAAIRIVIDIAVSMVISLIIVSLVLR